MMVTATEMMMMMIPMKSDVMTMAMISPLREGISPADFSLPESFSLSLVFSASWRRRNISSMTPRGLGFPGDEVREGAPAEVGQGLLTTWRRARGVSGGYPEVGSRCGIVYVQEGTEVQ